MNNKQLIQAGIIEATQTLLKDVYHIDFLHSVEEGFNKKLLESYKKDLAIVEDDPDRRRIEIELLRARITEFLDLDFSYLLFDSLTNLFLEQLNYEQIVNEIPIDSWTERVAQNYSDVRANLKATDIIADYLPQPGGKILDIGCNDGGLVNKLVEMGHVCYGVELPEIIKEAQAEHPNITGRLSVCNLEYDELPDGPYDLALLLGILHLIKNYALLLPKIARVLKPGGVLYLTTTNKGCRTIDTWHIHHFTEGEITKLAEQAGLEPIEYRKYSRSDLTGIFRKT